MKRTAGAFFSGEELASLLGVSRSAVWKAVKVLREEGHSITAVTNKGYSLDAASDILSQEGIVLHLLPKYRNLPVLIHKSTSSTNEDAKALAVCGAVHGSMVLAEEQTAGRGRLGRTFYSPKSAGLYLSIVLRPELSLTDAVLMTTAAAVSVSRAIEEVAGCFPQIKWVNDVFVNDKKVCGILTETVSGFESGTVECVVVGIGINVVDVGIPDDLRDIVGALCVGTPAFSRNHLAAVVVNHLLELGDTLADRSFLNEYRRRSMILGKLIRFLENNVWHDAVALSLDNSGGLVVKTDDGVRTLSSGEVSIQQRD